MRSRFPCQVLLRDSSCLRAPGIRVAWKLPRGWCTEQPTANMKCKGQRGRRTDHLESKAFAHDRGIVARCRPRAVTLMTAAEPATASVILTKRIPVTAICSLAASQFDVLLLEFGSGAQEEHARLLTTQSWENFCTFRMRRAAAPLSLPRPR